jgi:carbonic anhydrase
MHFPKQMLLNNVAWANEALYGDPELFERLRCGQTPKVLWIGCADSRVPAEIITDARPGELFVHRNIANLFLPHDDNTMSVVEYAVSVLEVKDIVICGHYGCGGVRASLAAVREDLPHVEQRIRALRRLARQHENELDAIADIGERTNRLVEISVAEQARLVSAAPVVRDAVQRPSVHAWVFDICNGLIRTLPHEPADDWVDQRSYAAGGAKAVYGRSLVRCEEPPAREAADV